MKQQLLAFILLRTSAKAQEYFHLAKGRDLGFNSVAWINVALVGGHPTVRESVLPQVLKFFSKLSSGSGEQLLTRQMFRLGQLLCTCCTENLR